MASKKYGIFDYGEVYNVGKKPGTRGTYMGVLSVDQDAKRFYLKREGKAAQNISYEKVNWLLGNDLIDFYQADSRTMLIDYMMRLKEAKIEQQEHDYKKYTENKRIKSVRENTKLIKKTKSRARMSKIVWFLGCVMIVVLGVVTSLPTPEPAPAEQSIAGVGMQYPIDQELLEEATYISAVGNGSELYGIVMDNDISESGTTNSNESPIKENVLVNSAVSQTYPTHMRPLYYDKTNFYQTQLVLDDANGGSSGILLQNPSGLSAGKPANELVLFGGKGMSSIAISSPTPFVAPSVSGSAQDLEEAQKQAVDQQLGRSNSQANQREKYYASDMPVGWNGYDIADIDNNMIAASYWYTRDSTGKAEDLKRRVVIWNIQPVLDQGERGLEQLEPIQINYQDKDSDYYAPAISMSPASNGAKYWVAYMKKVPTGETGFFVRSYETSNPTDILVESPENTFSTRDLTGNDHPITNYKLVGDRLFYEQQGYIWVIDLSKASVQWDQNATTQQQQQAEDQGQESSEDENATATNNNGRYIKKENPIQICRSNEIQPSNTRDEKFIANINRETPIPVSHYQVLTVSMDNGQLVYGIAFLEADTGNLVFQPCNGAAAASTESGSFAGGNSGSATDVSSGDQAMIEKGLREEEERNQQRNNRSTNSNVAVNINYSSTNNTNNGLEGLSSSATTSNNNSGVNVQQSAYSDSSSENSSISNTRTYLANDSEETNNGRILIKAGQADIEIVCFSIRGEQFFWLERNRSSNARKLMCSPIYYKNDASQLSSDSLEEVDDNGEIVQEGIQPSQAQSSFSTGADSIINNITDQSQNQNNSNGFEQNSSEASGISSSQDQSETQLE